MMLHSVEEVLDRVEAELAAGCVKNALGYAQCLWAFCSCEQELRDHLDHIRTELAPRYRVYLTLDDRHRLSHGLCEVLLDVCRPADNGRCLLAASAA